MFNKINFAKFYFYFVATSYCFFTFKKKKKKKLDICTKNFPNHL